ncbi:MAG: NADH-quinone oxidoreductase subunit NuoK [Fibrobacteria bacterium]|nr:NADH-quinone oxidoreductase subunit NuoK [Fibrobacteria bacterium]
MSQVSLEHFLIVSALLFSLGIIAVVTRRNAVAILIGIELIINSACLNFIAFSRFNSTVVEGSLFVLFVIVMAAAEAVVALALILAIQKRIRSVEIDKTSSLKG